MAAHIEFNPEFQNASNAVAGIQPGPTPTLKDQIYSGAILKEMYFKSKPNMPTADTVHLFDNNQFLESVKERQKAIHERIIQEKQNLANPEES